MDYNKPSKEKANEQYLRMMGYKRGNPYEEERKEIKKTFLIVCEGKNTERYYFEGFPVPSKTVTVLGGCNSKTSLVEYALKVRNFEKYAGREVWCVFDFDVKPDEAATQSQDFNNAILRAEQNGMKVAWSNDAFELWFVLHYADLQSPLSRHELYGILKEKWNLEEFTNTAKTVIFCKEHYERHGGSESQAQKLAVRRARVLHQQHNGNRSYADQCPCTTVYLLVEELNKYLK